MWFDYIVVKDRNNPLKTNDTDVISDLSNVPYDRMQYNAINPLGKQWIFKYCLATTKEMQGNIRSKYSTVPIPGGEVTLDGAELRAEAKDEMSNLLEKLRDMLDKSLRVNQLENKDKESDAMNKMLSKVPVHIYIG